MTILWIIIGILVFFMYYVIGIAILTVIDAITGQFMEDGLILWLAFLWPVYAFGVWVIYLTKALLKLPGATIRTVKKQFREKHEGGSRRDKAGRVAGAKERD